MTLACDHCGIHYGDLLRGDLWQAYTCQRCDQESCHQCVARTDQGDRIAFLTCPKCSADSLRGLDLRNRFSIFTPTAELRTFDRALALPFVASSLADSCVYPRRTENLIRSALPKLEQFGPRFVLVDEGDEQERQQLADWFPSRFNPQTATRSGTLIWITDGVATRCSGGPLLTEYEILKTSRELWADANE